MKDISLWRNRHPIQTAPIEAEYSHSAEKDEVELRDYLNILVKHRRLLVLVFITVVIIGAYCTFTATPLYQSSSILQIEPQNPSVTGVGEMVRLSESGGPSYDYYQTQFKLLESKTLAARVITELKLDSNRIFTGGEVKTANPVDRGKAWFVSNLNFIASLVSVKEPDAPHSKSANSEVAANAKNTSGHTEATTPTPDVEAGLIGRYQQFLGVWPIKSTRLVEIAFMTPDPELSRQLADAHAWGFIRLSLKNRFALTKEARDFLDGKNAELKDKLERSEDALNRFRQTYSVVSMDRGENIVVERLVEINRQLTAARAQRLDAESLYKVVEDKSTQSLSQVVNQGMVPNLRSSLLTLEAEKVKLASTFKPDHPRMVELNQQISEMRRSLTTEINNVVRGIQENYFAARSKEQSLEAEAQKQQQAALNMKEVGVQYAVLEEEVKVNRTLYESVLKRLNETNISNDIAVSNMQVTQNADKSMSPFTPNVPINLVISGCVGLFLGVGLVFVREYFDSSLNTPQHVWHAVALSTLGVIPDLSNLNRRFLDYYSDFAEKCLPRRLAPARDQTSSTSKDLVVSHHPSSLLAESYRSLRTALLFSQPEKPPKVILLTSPSPSEGKTMTTVNLAITFAQDKNNVLLMDADLRKGCCHTRLGAKNRRGLSNVLTGNVTLEEAIQKTSVSGLSIVPRGICPPNPTDLLGSQRMRQTLSRLRESFDFILIDSPPGIAVSDAAILSVICDGVLLVFHGQKTTAVSARQVLDRLDAVRAPVLGVVLNSIDLSNREYIYYRHYYGSDYAVVKPENGDGSHVGTLAEDELYKAEAQPEEMGPGTVPPDFFDDMTLKFSEAVGPMAPLILANKVLLLGESREAFPRNRLKELFERVDEEILDDRLRKHFQRSMQEQLKAFSHTNLGMKAISPGELGPGNIPREFFARMTSVLCGAAGPMAPLIVQDQVARLGESLESFPKSRLKELFERICSEIIDQKLKREFQQTMSSEIQSL
jgi:succinoglycan biosynthesis transport protein ExoP